MIGFSMTGYTKSYTVIWKRIIFDVIYMMNTIAALATDSANVVVSYAYQLLKSFIECGRIGFKRFTTAPAWCIFASHSYGSSLIMTRLRTILAASIHLISFKRFTAIWTSHCLWAAVPEIAFVPPYFVGRMAGLGTELSYLIKMWPRQIFFTTIKTYLFYLATLPISRFFTSTIFSHARMRTISGSFSTVRMYLENIPAIFTSLFNLRLTVWMRHHIPKWSTPPGNRMLFRHRGPNGVHKNPTTASPEHKYYTIVKE